MAGTKAYPLVLIPVSPLGCLRILDDPCPLVGGTWYEVDAADEGFACTFQPGTLAGATHLTCDVLLDGTLAVEFAIHLCEGADGPDFFCQFGFLNQCQARIRLPLEAVEQNRWLYPREGAWVKPIAAGDRVDLARVDRLTFIVLRKAEGPVRWAMTPLQAVDRRPPRLTDPMLPAGRLLDELGQTTLVDWPGKTCSEAELVERLRAQQAQAPGCRWPRAFSRYGGWRERRFGPTGFFRTHHDGRRWWLVDPEGCAFWSAGLDCVRAGIETNAGGLETALTWIPQAANGLAEAIDRRHGELTVDYLRANFIRAFGPNAWRGAWAEIALALLRRFGFNTVANWSDWEVAAAAGFPYVRPLRWPAPDGPQAPRIFRDFPDVFDPTFAAEAAHFARQLEATRDDPAFIGYFLMNEPTWGFASLTPAEGMLYACEGGPTRQTLADFCRQRYADDRALAAVWGEGVTFESLARGRWTRPVAPAAQATLGAFSTVMVEKLYTTLTDACRAVDPNHLNLGARYFRVPPAWAMGGMACFDVFSVNGYRETVDRGLADACKAMGVPAMIGEWHFGALDVGLPASGIGRVATQADRGKAYRIYVEDAAAQPWCVGVHHFTLYDQSALGRGDGEAYNIGFVDVCHRPYEPLADAARAAHERLYDIADGKVAPFEDAPAYLPKLFF
ncbi:MAG: hypothetical protein GX591_03185 [Planctomycetes bacterium]|nr:hypothetical protein [Planctomycetota bacterium]